MRLRYDAPAHTWNEALPLGNGHLGAMVFGGVHRECLMLNDECLWYRGKSNRNNPDSFKYLKAIRELLLQGEISKAEELVRFAMFATPRDQSHYELLGELYIEQVGISSEVEEYRRVLDISEAKAAIAFTDIDTKTVFTREFFTSFSNNALCCNLTASVPHALNLNINLGRNKRFNDSIEQINDSTFVMHVSAGGKEGVQAKVCIHVKVLDGECKLIGETLVVRGSSQAQVFVKSITNYWSEFDSEHIAKELDALAQLDYHTEFEAHKAQYQSQFNRVGFELEHSKLDEEFSVTELLSNVEDYEQYLTNLLFHFGRYLLLSSSQPGGLPSNLQGIWCEDLNPIWGSKYTININTQMNYWMCGPCDMQEAQLPLFDMLERMREQGRITAKTMYGASGFCAHHNTDGFGDCAPQSHAMGAAIWVLAVPWLCTHLWEHYCYFGDKQILEVHFDMLKEAFEFFEDYLFEVDGFLCTGPSASPENKFRLPNGECGNVCIAPTIDNQILRHFCLCCDSIAEVLGDTSDFSQRVHALSSKLMPTQIGKHGQIQEWREDYEEVEPGHRHISPLYGLYPACEIDVYKTPELAQAARVTIARRLENTGFLNVQDRSQAINNWVASGAHQETHQTGWSAAWLVHFFARLQQGNDARTQIMGLMQNATLPNLFMDHPPFQIDGNLGFTSGICELLVQSHGECLLILPALPSHWTKGSVRGLRARGGYKLSFSWEDRRLQELAIENGCPGSQLTYKVFYPNNTAVEYTDVFDNLGSIQRKFSC